MNTKLKDLNNKWNDFYDENSISIWENDDMEDKIIDWVNENNKHYFYTKNIQETINFIQKELTQTKKRAKNE